MSWNHDITSAPRDRKLWLASECGAVVGPTTWDKKREQWAGFATRGKPPLAWQLYIVPEHPGASVIVHRHTEINLPIVHECGGGA
ncbi:hypothetical protein [Neorhizobium tomejilense]|uniref:hypothetical protein n=1 Tax=Neorhizobium tomejilense TaxID=2093828 RepID=UPI000CF92C2B|nr:hypothetical protein [Neorhizobium tomejilense]